MQFIICERGRSFSALESEQWCCAFTVTSIGYDSIPVIHGTFDVYSNSLTYHKYLFTYSLSARTQWCTIFQFT